MRFKFLAISIFAVTLQTFAAVPKGELATIFREDFSLLTDGSADVPATEELSSTGKVDVSLMHGQEWKGRGLHSAGGSMAVMTFEQSDWFGTETVQGYIQTPYIDVRMDEGQFILRFKAKAIGETSQKLKIELYDAYTTNSIDAAEVSITGGWDIYDVNLKHPGYGNHLAYMQIVSLDGQWLVDDVEVIQDYYELIPPIVHFPRNVSYEQFTGRWNMAPLAESYLVSVFSMTGDNERQYIVKDKPTTECTMTVEGTVRGTDYFYVVKSVNSRYTSVESEPRRVHVPLTELETPETLEAAEITENGFVARWKPSFRAMGYIVDLKREHTAVADEVFTVLKEDFSKFVGYEGYEDYPMSFYGNIDEYTLVSGWKPSDWTVYVTGMFGLDNYWKKYEDIYLTSPVLDLTGDGGKFRLSLSVKGTLDDVIHVECGGKTLSHKLTQDGLQSFSLDFDNGTDATTFTIRFDGDGKLLFDEITVSQTIHAGEPVVEKVGAVTIEEPVTEYSFSNLNASKGDVFVYTVKAWSYSLDEDGVWGPNVYSALSDARRVEIGVSSLTDIDTPGASVRAVNGTLMVSVGRPAIVEAYAIDGRMCGRWSVEAGNSILDFARKGIFVIKVGDETFKIAI